MHGILNMFEAYFWRYIYDDVCVRVRRRPIDEFGVLVCARSQLLSLSPYLPFPHFTMIVAHYSSQFNIEAHIYECQIEQTKH